MQTLNPLNKAANLSNQASISVRASAKLSRPWLQDLSLWILLVGPLVAPFFVVLNIPILRPFADGIYLLGEAICPKPDSHLTFLGEPMAVCSSCWAAVFGLWAIRLLYGRAGEGFGPFSRLGLSSFWARWQNGVTPATKIALLLLFFMPWAFDLITWDLGLWASPDAYMMIAGFLGGVGAGGLLLPAASEMRDRLARG